MKENIAANKQNFSSALKHKCTHLEIKNRDFYIEFCIWVKRESDVVFSSIKYEWRCGGFHPRIHHIDSPEFQGLCTAYMYVDGGGWLTTVTTTATPHAATYRPIHIHEAMSCRLCDTIHRTYTYTRGKLSLSATSYLNMYMRIFENRIQIVNCILFLSKSHYTNTEFNFI